MEIILREDIDKLGQRGEMVKVAAGYARNFLLPRKPGRGRPPNPTKRSWSRSARRTSAGKPSRRPRRRTWAS